ncbi:MAG: hypothetical protein JXQ97_06965 [Natronospirillum sp.]
MYSPPLLLNRSYRFWALIAALDMILFTVVIMPWGAARLIELSGGIASGGVGPYDVLLSYSPELFYQMASAYGDAGRSFYIVFQLLADTAYPLTYGLFGYFLMTWLCYEAWPHRRWYRFVFVFPLATVILDFLENGLIVALLWQYPTQQPAWVHVASATTTLKWVSVMIGSLVLVVLAGAALRRFLVERGFRVDSGG